MDENGMTSEYEITCLERKANKILGEKPIEKREVFRLRRGKDYRPIGTEDGEHSYKYPQSGRHNGSWAGFCEDCGQPRHHLAGRLCRSCYRNRAQRKYTSKISAVQYWEDKAINSASEYQNDERTKIQAIPDFFDRLIEEDE